MKQEISLVLAEALNDNYNKFMSTEGLEVIDKIGDEHISFIFDDYHYIAEWRGDAWYVTQV